MSKLQEALEMCMEEEFARLDKEIAAMPEPEYSKRHLKNINAMFREDIGKKDVMHPEVDNAIERLRSKIVIKYAPRLDWLSRNRKRKKRIKTK